MGSRSGSVESQLSLGQVPIKSRANPREVQVGFCVSLSRVRRFKNEILKVLTSFVDLKTVNHFLKIKEKFLVKKIKLVDHYFT